MNEACAQRDKIRNPSAMALLWRDIMRCCVRRVVDNGAHPPILLLRAPNGYARCRTESACLEFNNAGVHCSRTI